MSDEAGAGRLVTGTRVVVLLMILGFVASVVLFVGVTVLTFASAIGGIDALLSFVGALRSERPLLVGGVLSAALLSVVGSLVVIAALVARLRRIFEQQVHVRVTDTGVTVRREKSQYWQSSGVDVPFEAITAVEYADPDESSMRVAFGDWRAPKFFAGRSRSWIRIERDGDPAVYVGSDRSGELAEMIARNSPGVESATPF